MTRQIPLTKGFYALVDDEDFEALSQYSWHATTKQPVYAGTRLPFDGERRKYVLMHRQILQPPVGFVVDHINRDGLDNRRCNLRVATWSQNGANCRSTRGSSKFKGVMWNTRRSKWRAILKVSRRELHLGLFDNEEDAARAYDEAAIREFGEFALPNFGGAK